MGEMIGKNTSGSRWALFYCLMSPVQCFCRPALSTMLKCEVQDGTLYGRVRIVGEVGGVGGVAVVHSGSRQLCTDR